MPMKIFRPARKILEYTCRVGIFTGFADRFCITTRTPYASDWLHLVRLPW